VNKCRKTATGSQDVHLVYNLIFNELSHHSWQFFAKSKLPRFCHELSGIFGVFCAVE